MKKQLLKKVEVSEALSVSVSVINELVQQNILETVEIKPGIVRIKRSSVLNYIKTKSPDNKGTVFLRRLFSFLWIATIVAFATHLLISFNYGSDKYWQDWRVWLFLGNIGLGIIFFLAAFLTIGKSTGKKMSVPRKAAWSIPIIYFLITVIPALADIDFSQRRVVPAIVPPVPTITITLSPTTVKANTQAITNPKTTGSHVDCIGPDGKQFKTSMEECKKLNEKWGKSLDYMTDCNIHADCGGGTVRMSYSQCMKPCSGKANTNTAPAVVYVTSAPSANKTPVFLSYGGYTVNCPTQNVGAVMSINSTMESKKAEWAKNYSDCTDRYFSTSACPVECKNNNQSGLDSCYAQYGYSGESSNACTKVVWDGYSSCIGKCSPNSAESCQYVYAEQKSLSSQITNLCK